MNEVDKKEPINDLKKDYVDRVFAKAVEGLETLSESYQNISQMETELVTRIERVETASSSIQSQIESLGNDVTRFENVVSEFQKTLSKIEDLSSSLNKILEKLSVADLHDLSNKIDETKEAFEREEKKNRKNEDKVAKPASNFGKNLIKKKRRYKLIYLQLYTNIIIPLIIL